MEATTLLNKLGQAATEAKSKADVVAKKKADLASLIADRQADIDQAEQAYAEAKVKADALGVQWQAMMAEMLPASDPRFRVSQ